MEAKQEFTFIDLGLPSGTKWADRNMGASSPEKYGGYFTFDEANGLKFDKDASVPTLTQIKELIDKCKWKWASRNGIKGYFVTGPNGNAIFLPAAGYRDGTSLIYAGSYGYYWSSTAGESGSNYAYDLGFDSGGNDWYIYDNRYDGFSVRPVSNKK